MCESLGYGLPFSLLWGPSNLPPVDTVGCTSLENKAITCLSLVPVWRIHAVLRMPVWVMSSTYSGNGSSEPLQHVSRKEFQAFGVSIIHTYIMAFCSCNDTRILNLYIPLYWNHTQTHHRQEDSFGWVISSSQRPLPDNTQHSQQTDVHAPGGFRTHNFSKWAAADHTLDSTATRVATSAYTDI